MGQLRPLFVYFRSFHRKFFRKSVGFSGIRTLIIRVEGDYLNTTTALKATFSGNCFFAKQFIQKLPFMGHKIDANIFYILLTNG